MLVAFGGAGRDLAAPQHWGACWLGQVLKTVWFEVAGIGAEDGRDCGQLRGHAEPTAQDGPGHCSPQLLVL